MARTTAICMLVCVNARLQSDPYLMPAKSEEGQELTGNDRYQGRPIPGILCRPGLSASNSDLSDTPLTLTQRL